MTPERGSGATSLGASHLPLREAVLAGLRSAIISGEYQAGERLLEEEIAARFGVSRNPIREALQALSTDGFVVIEPRRGARVATIDRRRALELFELRQPLEGLVARLAAERRSDAQVAALAALVEQGSAAASARRLDDLPRLNTEFHELLAAAADNQLLSTSLSRLSHVIQWIYSVRISDRSADSWVEHVSIYEAIADGNGSRAAELGEAHIVSARNAFLE